MRIRYFVQTFAMAMICVGAAMLAHAQSASGNTNQSCVVGVQMTDREYGLKGEPGNATIGLHPMPDLSIFASAVVVATTTAMPIQADQ